MEKATDLLPTTIEGCLDATPICMIEKVLDKIKIEAFIAYHITRTCAMINIDSRLNIQPQQVSFIAKSLIDNFTYESLADINLCLKRGVSGFYGQIFRIDGAVINNWMQAYLDEKYDALEQRKNKEKHPEPKAKPVKNIVDGGKYIAQMLENLGVPKEPENNAKENAFQRHKVENPYPSTPPEEVEKKILHIQYIREMTATGLPKEKWTPEIEWIEGLKK